MPAAITLYTKNHCPYCVKAKTLLKQKGAEARIQEIDVAADSARLQEMIEKSGGRRTVPQIFIGDKHIGGADDLYALNEAGGLDALLR